MKVVVFTGYGAPGRVMKLAEDFPVSHAYDTRDQVLIKVHAAAVNPVDKVVMSGEMKLVKPVEAFPHVISYDAAGTVAFADTADAFKVGDEVMVRLFGPAPGVETKGTPYFRGSMAEYCVAPNTVRRSLLTYPLLRQLLPPWLALRLSNVFELLALPLVRRFSSLVVLEVLELWLSNLPSTC